MLVANSSLNETCYKMIENLNTSVKKYSDKKMAFFSNDFENQITELKNKNLIQLAAKYENIWKQQSLTISK